VAANEYFIFNIELCSSGRGVLNILKFEMIVGGTDMMGMRIYISSVPAHMLLRALKFSQRPPTGYGQGVSSFYTRYLTPHISS